MKQPSISEFENEVMFNVSLGNATPKVNDTHGDTPIVACLDTEPFSELLKRVNDCSGNATIYSRADNGTVRALGAIRSNGFLTKNPTDLPKDGISPESAIGIFIDYVSTQPSGVELGPKFQGRIKSYGLATLTHV